jgi:hypothetical protein
MFIFKPIFLTGRPEFWNRLRQDRIEWRELLPILAFIIVSCGIYGSVMAGWRSHLLSLYVAIKLPLLFIGSTVIVAVFNWMIAAWLGADLSLKTVVFIVFGSMAVTSWILLSLTPVSLFFLFTGLAGAGTHEQLRYSHNCILLTHIIVLTLAGTMGNRALLDGLRTIIAPRCPATTLFVCWLLVFGFVGCQLSWILRPFVGSPFYSIEFLRSDALNRNFYEFILGEVLPTFLKGG